MDRICYRKHEKYTKYKLENPYSIKISITPEDEISRYKITLSKAGDLMVKERYTWDGPSGPTLDTSTFMRASLVHDVLYQLMRTGDLKREKYRKPADQVMRKICREDGMNAFRAWYVYWGVRLFAGAAAKRKPQPVVQIYAP